MCLYKIVSLNKLLWNLESRLVNNAIHSLHVRCIYNAMHWVNFSSVNVLLSNGTKPNVHIQNHKYISCPRVQLQMCEIRFLFVITNSECVGHQFLFVTISV